MEENKPDFRELDLGSTISPHPPRRSSDAVSNHSGEFEASRSAPPSKLRHRRSASVGSPLIYSGGGGASSSSSGGSACSATGAAASVSSPVPPKRHVTTSSSPAGNICPSGVVLKSKIAMSPSSRTRSDILGSGTANYGHGSIVRAPPPRAPLDPEEVKRVGNEMYRKGNFLEALACYDKAILVSPENAAYRSNKAAALAMIGRVSEAVRECEVAVRIDAGYDRAHHRLASLFLRLGHVENARNHLCFKGQQNDKSELEKVVLVEKHLSQCADMRKISDWKRVLRECEAAKIAGADCSPQIMASKGEAFVKLHQLANADFSLSSVINAEPYPASCLQTKFCGMLLEAYLQYVRSLVDMSFGRFESAMAAAEKAAKLDHSNIEVALLLNNVKLVSRARSRGKDLFDAGRFSEASTAYGDGLKYELSNSVLYCNRAICWSKLGLWEQSILDCNQALKIHPNYTKALLRRAVSNAKLERWGEAVKDYEILRKELPGDSEVCESLRLAQNSMKKMQLGEVNMGAS